MPNNSRRLGAKRKNADTSQKKQEKKFVKGNSDSYDAMNDNDDRNVRSEKVSQQTDSTYKQTDSATESNSHYAVIDTLYYQLKLQDDSSNTIDNLISYSLVSNGSTNSYNFNSLRRLSNPINTHSNTILSVTGNRFDSSDLPNNFSLDGMLKESYTLQNATNEDETENFQLEFNMLYSDDGSNNVTEGGKTVNGLIILNCGKYNLKYNTAEKVTITFYDDELKTREIKLYGYNEAKKDSIERKLKRIRERKYSK